MGYFRGYKESSGWSFQLATQQNTGGQEGPDSLNRQDNQKNGAARAYRQRRRDRHGRGLRGPLVPKPHPGARSRSELFDDVVVESAERLQDIWGSALDRVRFVVKDIPDHLEDLVARQEPAPLADFTPRHQGEPDIVTVYRMPLVQTSRSAEDLAERVHDAVIEQVAILLNLSPEAVDPSYGRLHGR
ncbi:metallopeptidase family protein [Psychromicrobium xiongbiense]|uniref:metallopeptidase family protein n=1 Tax=Psychromicrobium xiongbiense TaxID=3051184 RepID=UPI0025529DC6|nr:metallopeptidase family protein [Psychromicrobium sp. YIM S02556]